MKNELNDGLNAARGIMFGSILGALLWMVLIILFAVHGNEPEPDAGCKNEFGRVVDCE